MGIMASQAAWGQTRAQRRVAQKVDQKKLRRQLLRETAYPKCIKWKLAVKRLIQAKREQLYRAFSRVESRVLKQSVAGGQGKRELVLLESQLQRERDGQRRGAEDALRFRQKVRDLTAFFNGQGRPSTPQSGRSLRLAQRAAQENADLRARLAALPDLRALLTDAEAVEAALGLEVGRLAAAYTEQSRQLTQTLASIAADRDAQSQALRQSLATLRSEADADLQGIRRQACKLALRRALVKLAVDQTKRGAMWEHLKKGLRYRTQDELARTLESGSALVSQAEALARENQDQQLVKQRSDLEARLARKKEGLVLRGPEVLVPWKKAVLKLVEEDRQRSAMWTQLQRGSQASRRDQYEQLAADFSAARGQVEAAAGEEARRQEREIQDRVAMKTKLKALRQYLEGHPSIPTSMESPTRQ